jgi:O-methyltransferase
MQKSKEDRYSGLFSKVENTFSDMPGAILVKGFVPKILQQVDAESISYLHLDMNAAYPEVEALKYFWKRLCSGAVIILDDYGFAGHQVQKNELDKLLHEFGSSILTLPTGQGLIVKA